MNLDWQLRERPLQPVAVAAIGTAARALVASVERRAELRLRGVAGDDVLVFLGDEDELPWADGAIYLGRDEDAPSLLLPTTLRPTLPLPLVERAFLRRGWGPFALLPASRMLLPLDAAKIVTRERLAQWKQR